MQTAARQLIIGWNTQAGVSRITWCDFHRPISHGDTHTNSRAHTGREMSGGVGFCLQRPEWVTSLRTLRHGNTARALTASKNSDTAFSQVRTNAGKQEADAGDREGGEQYAPSSYFVIWGHLWPRRHKHTHTQNQMIPVITFLNLPLECVLVGHSQETKRPKR